MFDRSNQDPMRDRPRHRAHHDERGQREGFGPPRGPFGEEGGFGRAARAGRRAGLHRPFAFGGFGRGPIARRGDVRTAILAVLSDGPMHGYQVMQELSARSGGVWAPSAGSVYPTLQQLEDEGLVRGEERDGRRVFTLTEDGRKAAATATQAAAPWDTERGREGSDLPALFKQVAQATMQVYQFGSPSAIAEARRILGATRRDMYRLLGSDDEEAASAGAEPAADPKDAPGA